MAEEKEKTFYRNIHYCADVSGTGFWRHIAPITTANCVQERTKVINTYTQQPILDPRYYVGMNSVVMQRWITNYHKDVVQKFLRPLTLKTGTWLIYEIDDAMGADDIPLYNRGHDAFQSKEIQDNIQYMLSVSDLVVVTTEYIKDYYHRKYGVPLERIIVTPNLLPRWWYGDRYDKERKVAQYLKYKSKPRIGIISSLSHYNIMNAKDENGNIYGDDFDLVADAIRETVDDYNWVILGTAPRQVRDLAEKKKITCYPCVPILGYPAMIEHLQLQAIVAPLIDNEFNRCKSNIKYLECCASGIPLYASNVIPYKGVVPYQFLFSTQDELKDKLKKMKFGSAGAYGKAIEGNWNWLNSKSKFGDIELNDFWMESNLGVWMRLFCLPLKKRQENNKNGQDKQQLH